MGSIEVQSDIEPVLARVRSKSSGRTRYEGQQPYDDEVMLAEIEALRTELKRQNEVAMSGVLKWAEDLTFEEKANLHAADAKTAWAECEALRKELEQAKADNAHLRAERLYIVGCNDGWDSAIEQAAELIEDTIIQDTRDGKVLKPRQDGNQDGLFYAVSIRSALAATGKTQEGE